MIAAKPRAPLSKDDFLADPHAAKYRGTVEANGEAFTRLLAVLNDPANEQRLEDAERHGKPALAGVADLIDREHGIVVVLDSPDDGMRFRQAVGVAVKLKMTKLGWTPSGRKGTVSNTTHFTKAERYTAPERPDRSNETDEERIARAIAGLDRIANMGTPEEQKETGEWLMQALAETRAAQGRGF